MFPLSLAPTWDGKRESEPAEHVSFPVRNNMVAKAVAISPRWSVMEPTCNKIVMVYGKRPAWSAARVCFTLPSRRQCSLVENTEIGRRRCSRFGEFYYCCCLYLLHSSPAAFTQPGASTLADLFTDVPASDTVCRDTPLTVPLPSKACPK